MCLKVYSIIDHPKVNTSISVNFRKQALFFAGALCRFLQLGIPKMSVICSDLERSILLMILSSNGEYVGWTYLKIKFDSSFCMSYGKAVL